MTVNEAAVLREKWQGQTILIRVKTLHPRIRIQHQWLFGGQVHLHSLW
jgi:hypothetical protein